MITMEPRADLVHFEHDGVKYAMTRAELDAAYAYVEREFQEEDALRQLDYFVFGYSEPSFGVDPDMATGGEAEDMADFEEKYGISYMEAKKLKGQFTTVYVCTNDCNQAENDRWHDAIACVLDDMKERNQAQS